MKNRYEINDDILKYIFYPNKQEVIPYIDTLVIFSERVRKEGLFVIEPEIPFLEPAYFQLSLQLLMDGAYPDFARDLLLHKKKSLLLEYRDILKYFFFILTNLQNSDLSTTSKLYVSSLWIEEEKRNLLISLPKTLIDLQDKWIQKLEVNLPVQLKEIFVVLNSKLPKDLEKELVDLHRYNMENTRESLLNIFLEGALSIQSGENPNKVRELLYSFLPDKT